MRVLLVTPDEAFEAALRGAAKAAGETEVSQVDSVAEVGAAISVTSPHVVCIGPGIRQVDALSCAQDLALQAPSLSMVLVSGETGTSLLRAAMRAGYRDVVGTDGREPAKDALAAIRAAYGFVERGAGTSPTVESQPAEPNARVVTVFSTKGGVGKSVVATNLSVALAAHLHKRVILVDLDLHFGDMGIMLGLEPKHTIYDATQAFDRLDSEMLQGYLVTHSSGVRVLLAPVRPEDAESVTAARISRVLELLRDSTDYIVIDTPAALDDVVLTAIDRSDTVYAVATMDVASVKNTRISLQKLAQLGYRNGLVELVLNRSDSKVWLEPGEIERAVERPIIARIPSDRLVPRSVNKGTPVVLDAPKSGVARSLMELAEQLVGAEEGRDKDVAHG